MKSLAPRCFAQSLILAGCLTAAAEPALAASSQVWVLRNREDFRDAKLDGVALAADGTFHLSARVSEVMAPAQPNIWSLARDPSGRLHAGGGNDGRVYRARAGGGEPEVVLDTEELQVHALAFDSKGRLLAGTSPSGRVYRVEAGGIPVVIFDPEETYIWAMHVDARDRLYVATGGRGRVYRIDEPGPGAKAVIALDGREDHFRSLAAGSDGSIYAGSDQNGIIYRIAPDGSTSVVYDSPMREIASLLVVAEAGGGDRIYAAALASAPQRRAPGSAQQ
ncbi:MAG TPA: WD40 repeat domain-containing protein, partial [Candidatus Polarisedimenticolia bacterium]|nr:WD40 repeat domain-containing protein [Candidatus Polarisedimenticolia bacterium]